MVIYRVSTSKAQTTVDNVGYQVNSEIHGHLAGKQVRSLKHAPNAGLPGNRRTDTIYLVSSAN
ncbi:hypothetical protein DPMN_149870 [Dreissena polymorpha]|uniref:Uncharacterized protein n=1 Tax=Dreissena polymorpha TaxID=45954 RepID=A0A9D4FGM4_DREPO|nr:hypothetical protein DPMN_149870 [Dreissena polymorpha]